MENPTSSSVPAVFQFDSSEVRVVEKNGQPWFVVGDVCNALTIGNSSDALRRLDADEKGVGIIDTLGGPQEAAIINESGLYSLTLTSRKPEAKRFKKWVTSEVLPAIRRTGSYSYSVSADYRKPIDATGVFRAFFSLAVDLGFGHNQSMLSANQATRKLTDIDALALMGTTHLIADKQVMHFTPTDLGKRLGTSAHKFNLMLLGAGLQTNRQGVWIPTETGKPYAVVMDTSKRHGNGTPIQQVKWTEDVLNILACNQAA